MGRGAQRTNSAYYADREKALAERSKGYFKSFHEAQAQNHATNAEYYSRMQNASRGKRFAEDMVGTEAMKLKYKTITGRMYPSERLLPCRSYLLRRLRLEYTRLHDTLPVRESSPRTLTLTGTKQGGNLD